MTVTRILNDGAFKTEISNVLALHSVLSNLDNEKSDFEKEPSISNIVLRLNKIYQSLQTRTGVFSEKKIVAVQKDCYAVYDERSSEIWAQINEWKKNGANHEKIEALRTRIGPIPERQSDNDRLVEPIIRLTRMHNALDEIENGDWNEDKRADRATVVIPRGEMVQVQDNNNKYEQKPAVSRSMPLPSTPDVPPEESKETFFSKVQRLFRKASDRELRERNEKKERDFALKRPHTHPKIDKRNKEEKIFY
jgi:hypothetical protein